MKRLMLYTLFIAGAILLASCGLVGNQKDNLSKAPTAELIHLLEDEHEGGDNLFPEIIAELTARGSSASEAAPALARALAYNRRDSITASRPLVAMGPAAQLAIPILLVNLSNERADVRLGSAFVLGTIGKTSQCAIPQLAPLLWDQDSRVRSATAAALQTISGVELVDKIYELDPTVPGSVFLDEPDGTVSANAKAWWLATGKNIKWPVGDCKPKE